MRAGGTVGKGWSASEAEYGCGLQQKLCAARGW
jgi:hypothetical protein